MAAHLTEVHAGGGVLSRPGPDGDLRVAIVHRPKYDDWSLPKGKLDPGEQPIVGACREVLEETGVRPVLGPFLDTVRYAVSTKAGGTAPKRVDYWAMRADADEGFSPNDEIDGLAWLTLSDAERRASYAHDARVLAAFAALPTLTGTVLLLRHGRAGERTEWRADDALRPLDATGLAQAAAVARVLPWYGPRAVISADRTRCVQTIEPLAAALGLGIELEPTFAEEAYKAAPDRALDRVRALAASGRVTVVSSQGGVIPDIVGSLADADGVRLSEIEAAKGSLWALFFDGSTLRRADYVADLGHAPR